jgi:transcriptional regulator with XRE-family HTH domain
MYNMTQPQAETVQNNSLGENIRKLRVLNSFSQEYVAANLEMSQGNYARMENGDISINSKRLKQIAYVLGYSPEFLKNFDSEKLGSVLEKEEKPVELLNFNISIELKELYEARIKVLETQIEALKLKIEPAGVSVKEEVANGSETRMPELAEAGAATPKPEQSGTIAFEKAPVANATATVAIAEKQANKPNTQKANEIAVTEVHAM